jgi:hypothetical protein
MTFFAITTQSLRGNDIQRVLQLVREILPLFTGITTSYRMFTIILTSFLTDVILNQMYFARLFHRKHFLCSAKYQCVWSRF